MNPFQAILHEPPINWEKQVTQCEYYHGDSSHNCGIAVWKELPLLVTEMICKCNKNYYEHFASISAKGGSLGTYCLDCGFPSICSINRNYYSCEECNKFFTYDWRTIEYVPPVKLCKDCDVPVTTLRRSGSTRVSFS